MFEECAGHRQPLGTSNEAEYRWFDSRASLSTGHERTFAKGSINYDETFIPVAHYDTVCDVLAVAALERLQLRQFDVKMAFMYGTIQEDV